MGLMAGLESMVGGAIGAELMSTMSSFADSSTRSEMAMGFSK